MKKHRKLPVAGEAPSPADWEEIEKMCEGLERHGMNVTKVLNFKDGPIKLIGSLQPTKVLSEVRIKIEGDGWSMQAPHYEHGTLAGFKLSKTGTERSGRAWTAGT